MQVHLLSLNVLTTSRKVKLPRQSGCSWWFSVKKKHAENTFSYWIVHTHQIVWTASPIMEEVRDGGEKTDWMKHSAKYRLSPTFTTYRGTPVASIPWKATQGHNGKLGPLIQGEGGGSRCAVSKDQNKNKSGSSIWFLLRSFPPELNIIITTDPVHKLPLNQEVV